MSRSLSYIFPAAKDDDVCLLQDGLADVALELNGNLSNSINSEVSFLQHGYSRSISIASVNDLSFIEFTITGIQNGVLVTEDVTGPNNDIVFSDEVFDVILSIVPDNNANDILIGTGPTGFFPMINIDLERDVYRWSFVIQATVSGENIPTTVFSAVKNIINNGLTYDDNRESLIELKALSSEDLYYQEDKNELYRSILIEIEGDNATLGHELTLNFIQM